mgnify:CR=1 FL=1
MQSADFLSAVFFYLKVGENLNQNWIVENLNNAFSTWNGKLGELWGLVTTGPQTFKGGAVWSVMQTLHNGMVGVGYALVVLFFAISLCKNTMNFHELKRPEAAIHYFLRFVAAKALVGYGMDIMRQHGRYLRSYGVAARRNADRYRKCGISRQHTAMARNDSRQLVHYGAFLCNDPYRVWSLLPFVYVHSAGSAAAGGFCGGKHTIRGHIIFEKLCRRVLRGCGHCAGLCDLLGICQYADSSQR